MQRPHTRTWGGSSQAAGSVPLRLPRASFNVRSVSGSSHCSGRLQGSREAVERGRTLESASDRGATHTQQHTNGRGSYSLGRQPASCMFIARTCR